MTNQYFEGIQKFVVLELELGLIPVTGVDECCQVLVTLVSDFIMHSKVVISPP